MLARRESRSNTSAPIAIDALATGDDWLRRSSARSRASSSGKSNGLVR